MTVRALPVLDQPAAEPCCAPLADEVLSEAGAVRLAEQFAALGDPVRLRLVSLLANAEGGALCVCDLVDVGRSQPTVSHHLAKLVAAGICVSERRGRNVWYAVNRSVVEQLRATLATGDR